MCVSDGGHVSVCGVLNVSVCGVLIVSILGKDACV